MRDFPLAVMDYSSGNPETDYKPCDDVYEDHRAEGNYLVYHRSEHRWYYVHNQDPSEILLFQQYDSTVGLRSGMFAAFILLHLYLNDIYLYLLRGCSLCDP